MDKYDDALKDADKSIEIKPGWAKGYLRRGNALIKLKQFDEAQFSLKQGLEIEPNNNFIKTALDKADEEINNQSKELETGMAKVFLQADFWDKVKNNKKTAAFASQLDFIQIVNTIQKNPKLIQNFLQDQRILQTWLALSGLNYELPEDKEEEPKKEESKKEEPKKTTTTLNEKNDGNVEEINMDEEVIEETEEEKKIKENKILAAKAKEVGNEFYKKRDLEQALVHYNKAVELDPEEMVYYLNRSAVYLEQKQYEKSIEEAHESIRVGRKKFVSFEQIGKAYARIGTCYFKVLLKPKNRWKNTMKQ
jgi:stress-induced-phosphoprotein 1